MRIDQCAVSVCVADGEGRDRIVRTEAIPATSSVLQPVKVAGHHCERASPEGAVLWCGA